MKTFFLRMMLTVAAAGMMIPANAMSRSASRKDRDPVQRVPKAGSDQKAGPGAAATSPEAPTGDVRTRGTSQSGTDAKTATTGPDAGRAPIGNNTGTNDPGNAGGTGGTFGTPQ
jgi:hypothetical protein